MRPTDGHIVITMGPHGGGLGIANSMERRLKMSIEEAYWLQLMPHQLQAFAKATGHSPETILMSIVSDESNDSQESEDDDQSPEASPKE